LKITHDILSAALDGYEAEKKRNPLRPNVLSHGKITLSGPQSCTGTVTANSISMTCTPGMCEVTLAR